MKHRWVRWLPAVAVPAAIAAGAIVAPLAAGAADLPARSPQDVLELVAASDARAFSGTLEQSSELGLPELPTTGRTGGADDSADSVLELVTADHTAKVWADGPAHLRVQILDRLAERDAIRDGSDLWLYESTGKKVVHATVPERGEQAPTPDATATTPSALAQRFLAAVDPSTEVTLGSPTSVAGRDAYDLVLTPRTDATLVGRVSIAVDGQTGIPLRVQVTARGASAPAFEAGFRSFSDKRPAADVFSFTPPAGASVTEKSLHGRPADGAVPHPEPTVTGTGWATVVQLPAGSFPTEATSDPLFAQLTQPVDGGRALSTSLMSAFVTDDGRVFAGAVPVSALQSAAQQSATK
ncbi:DUF2092 domain-containing protein [Leifsonia sp. F6_8S_P_1B]|uniref:DUF2092 domain-containing protein n=1 Tax=Leifsonia williamsii TaxID=3035919 RepID=A0ABT8KDA1_9MICO|nr:DUF2092 domain-containing protein [Leifsonia williamsii]MDN4615439.1 DUF2092 domain-containing protein [Leifsonia williamsii]